MAAAKSLAEALLNVQKAAPKLEKDSKNPHYKNDYVSLDALLETIVPVLNANGVVVMQWPTALSRTTSQSEDGSQVQLGTEPALRTKLIHTPSGESMEDVMPLVLDRQSSQGLGSGITYARRYSLASILGLITETDDDGARASGTRKASGAPASLKRQVWEIAREELEKKNPSVAEVAKLFGVKQSELSDEEVLQGIIDEHGDDDA